MAENNNTAQPASQEPAAPSVKDFLDFDPFEPADAGQGGAQAPDPADSGSQSEPAAQAAEGDALPPSGGQAPSQQQPQQGAQASAPDPVLRELARINETLAASQQPQQQYTPPQVASPRFNLEIPQQILKAVIHSEDPEERAVGLAALVNGLANTLYNDISAEMRASQHQMYQALPQVHQRLNQEQVEQQRAASDFFGRFTNLQPTPQMMQFVAGEAKALAVEQWRAGNRNLQWNDDFREALGYRIHAGLGLPFPQRAAQPGTGMPAQRQPKRAQFAAGGDAKGGNGIAAPNQEAKEIWDVFGYN
jgi:hypothetical protein